MKKNIFKIWLMALPMLLGLAACAEHDNPTDPNPLAKQVSGLWWSLTEQEGTYSDAADSYPYTRMGQAVCFNEDGTGYGVTFFFNDEQGDPIAIIGGEWMAPFTYTSTADGRLSLNFDKAYYEYADYFKKWTMTYAAEAVTATNGTLTLTLEKASDAMAVMIRDWDEQFNGGAAIGSNGFNPNDPDFTFTNWRNEEGIYLYDGTGEYTFTHGNRTCKFSLVPLPWYKGTKQTNLPEGFCDEMLDPKSGWELAINLCGDTKSDIKNNNFFALYNKYTGILRFFYYVPAEFASGNDHMWQVTMTDNLAEHSLWKYGLPSDRHIKNKAALGQTVSETFTEYVSPWVDNLSSDGLITPAVGWWAFDVDLSTYRSNADHTDANFKLKFRSWQTSHTSLYSTINAKIDGSISLDQVKRKAGNSAQGVIMGMQALTQAASGIASFFSGNWGAGLAPFGQMFGTGAQVVGFYDGSKSGFDGSINLGLNGNIDTQGLIEGSAVVTGIAQPTIYLKDFDTKNTQVGQGVWNIKHAPVVYTCRNYRILMFLRDFEGLETTIESCTPCFFDPNSIELELNPNVFPEDQIEWLQVEGLCLARKNMQPSNDDLRSVYGLSSNMFSWTDGRPTMQIAGGDYREISTNSRNSPLFDFLYASTNKYGLDEYQRLWGPYDWTTWTDEIYCRCNSTFGIEPQFKLYPYRWVYPDVNQTSYHSGYFPFYEVNVKVTIKMKNIQTPIVLSRNYLPEYKAYGDGTNFANSVKKTKPYASKMKGHTDLYDYQMKRISDIMTQCSIPSKL